MKITRKNGGVAEVLSSVLLLAIAVSVFSVIYFQVLSDDGPLPEVNVTLIGKVEPQSDLHNTVAFENQRGEILSPDTKIILEIYGGLPITIKISDLASIYPFLGDGWDIGEKIYPVINLGDLTGPRIDATIVDKVSNSIVFWGRLQEGPIAPLSGRGGIWHFNETTGNIAHDSSGNNNDGLLVPPSNLDGPQWSTSSGNWIAGDCALEFDGFNDRIEVKSAYSLNMIDAITVEAWIKPEIEETIIKNIDFGTSFAFNPEIIHITNNLYVIVGEGQLKQDGIIITVNITHSGNISNPISQSKYDSFWGLTPNIINISKTNNFQIIAVAYSGKDNGILKTFKIFTNNGSISEKIDIWNFHLDRAYVPDIIKVAENIYAIAYRDLKDEKGFLKTVEILSDGQITPDLDGDPIGQLTFNNTAAFGPDLIKISDNTYAIAYRDSNNNGLIQTVQIEQNGQIISKIDEINFDSVSDNLIPHNSEQKIKIIHIDNSYYAVVYANQDDHGLLKTFQIGTNGNIIMPTIDALDFTLDFDNYCVDPDIIHVSNDTYAIIYTNDDDLGSLITVEIESNGIIKDTFEIISTSLSPPNKPLVFYSPEILHISDRVFVITYRAGKPHPGYLMTIRIGRDPTPPWARGIFKAGSITLYADAELKKVFATINGPDQLLTLDVTPGLWHHVVLTYDRSNKKICLYCNNKNRENAYPELKPGSTDEYINYNETYYDQTISLTPYNLVFGHLFCGYMDEVAIFDYALNPVNINTHFINPGIFEGEP